MRKKKKKHQNIQLEPWFDGWLEKKMAIKSASRKEKAIALMSRLNITNDCQTCFHYKTQDCDGHWDPLKENVKKI